MCIKYCASMFDHSNPNCRVIRIIFQIYLYCMASNLSANTEIIYPRPESTADARTNYPLQLLELALKKSGTDYALNPSKFQMQQGRALRQLEKRQGVDVVWSMTSLEREKALLPIRIPIYRGLIGWRLLLINKKDAIKFQQIHTVEQLKQLRAGQGHDWPDTAILRENGFEVHDSSTYEGLFKMLQNDRFEYFPRSIVEIWAEAENHKAENIIVEPTIVIRYPTAFYFFVNKQNLSLAKDLEKGLKQTIEDGSFDKLFYEHHDDLLKKADLKNRKFFELKNPILPPETPLNQKELWFQN